MMVLSHCKETSSENGVLVTLDLGVYVCQLLVAVSAPEKTAPPNCPE